MRDILIILLFAFFVYAGLVYFAGGFTRLQEILSLDIEAPGFIEAPVKFGRGLAERFQFGGR